MRIYLNPSREYLIANIVGGVLTTIHASLATFQLGMWFMSITALGQLIYTYRKIQRLRNTSFSEEKIYDSNCSEGFCNSIHSFGLLGVCGFIPDVYLDEFSEESERAIVKKEKTATKERQVNLLDLERITEQQ